jgi:hypothetical protein
MILMRRLCGPLLFTVALVGAALLTGPRPTAAEPSDSPFKTYGFDSKADREARWVGVASCASMACHHFNGSKGTKQSEYSTWAANDKHARAFQVLYEDRSEWIVRNLYGPKAKKATETELCLKCHASHDGDTTKVGDRFQLADGVGCESCHGGAEKWLTRHYEAGFKGLSLEEKAKLGMRPLKDLAYRAKLCTECHVGTADKECNHDLLAAGHPRLNFEFSAYHAIYPKHWNVADDRSRYPDLEARAWVVGQVVTARAALELLQARADAAQKKEQKTVRWPEFAEYDCYACHKDLKVDSPRQLAGYAGRKPGSLPWGTWYLTMTEAFADQSGVNLEKKGASVKNLRNLMQNPGLDAAEVAKEAAGLIETLETWLGRVQVEKIEPAKMKTMMKAFLDQAQVKTGDGKPRADAMNWDEAAQLYLALAALHQELATHGDPTSGERKQALLNVQSRLRQSFEKGYDSPRRFDPVQPPELSKLLLDVRNQRGN